MTVRRTYLSSINTLACSEAEIIIEPVLKNVNLTYFAQNHSFVTRLKKLFIDVRYTILLNLSFLTR